MRLQATSLQGLTLVEATQASDERGRFTRVFCEDELATLRPGLHFPQVNLSTTLRRGTVRGMHYQQPPMAEAKLIRCLRGRVFDVAVDLRTGSPTFLKWHGVELADDGLTQLFIPEGFAHGFQALTDDVQLLYLHTRAWSQAHEGGLRHDDPRLAIRWPLAVAMVSQKDRDARLLDDHFAGVST